MTLGEDWIDFLKSTELAMCRHTFSTLVTFQAMTDAPPRTCSKCKDLVLAIDRYLSLDDRPRHIDCERTTWKQSVYEAFKRWSQAKYGAPDQDHSQKPEGPEAS